MHQKEYVNLLQNVPDRILVTYILRLAIQGQVDLRVSLSRNITARRAPSNLSLSLVNNGTDTMQFNAQTPEPYYAFKVAIDELINSPIGKATCSTAVEPDSSMGIDLDRKPPSRDSQPNKSQEQAANDIFYPPSQVLPNVYDITYFGLSDFVYIDTPSLLSLEKVGQANINSFISPERTILSIQNNLLLNQKSIDDINLSEIDYGEYPIELPHGVPFRRDETLLLSDIYRQNKSVAFYAKLEDSVRLFQHIKQLFPISIQQARWFFDYTQNETQNIEDTINLSPVDEAWLRDLCNSKIKKLKNYQSRTPLQLVEFISHFDKWLPLQARDGDIRITLENLFVEKNQLASAIEAYTEVTSKQIEKTKDKPLSNHEKQQDKSLHSRKKVSFSKYSSDISASHSDGPIPYFSYNRFNMLFDKFKEKLINTQKNERHLYYRYLILVEFIRQMMHKEIGESPKDKRRLEYLRMNVYAITDALNNNEDFTSQRKSTGDNKSSATEDQIVNILNEILK